MKRIALLVEKDFQDLEVFYPYYRLKEADHEPVIIGSGTADKYVGKYGFTAVVDAHVGDVDAAQFDGVIVPGGWAPDHMRIHDDMVAFVRDIYNADKLVAAICHGGWMLASADIIRGKKVTGYRAIRDDLLHAGGLFEDSEVVVDGTIITSRTPDDLPAFCKAILAAID